jgi:hypothetical protein
MTASNWNVLATDITAVFRRIREVAKSDYWLHHVCMSVRPSVCMEQLGVHWTDFYEI